MKRLASILVVVCLLAACSSGGGDGGGPPATANSVPVSIGTWSTCVTINELCTSVTICQPGTGNCQTVSDVLVDIGSVGLRVFGSVLSTPLSQTVDAQGHAVGECAFFADGSTTWGGVHMADVVLGGAPAVRVPIQVIAATFGGQSASSNPCKGTVDVTPDEANLNGILGIGLFRQDCGLACETSTNNTLYFACNGGSCAGAAVPVSNQLQNPVWLLPSGNNGVALMLPNVPSSGAPSVTGSLILGIEAAAAQSAPTVVVPTDDQGFVTTVYKGRTFTQSIIDSGSNGLFFPDASIPTCAAPLNGFYCPPNTLNLSATIMGVNVPFQIANTQALTGTGNAAFNNLGGDLSTFDWGLPFFLGRTVFIGIEDQDSSLGKGPFFAF
jgi:hypothetical protein